MGFFIQGTSVPCEAPRGRLLDQAARAPGSPGPWIGPRRSTLKSDARSDLRRANRPGARECFIRSPRFLRVKVLFLRDPGGRVKRTDN